MHGILLALAISAGQVHSPSVAAPHRWIYSPVISEDTGTVAHVWWDGIALRDTRGNSWSMAGTVAQVSRGNASPAGAGAFTNSARYYLGSGSDALDFAGAFTAVFVVEPPSNSGAYPVIFGDGVAGSSGWGVYVDYGVSTNRIAGWIGTNTKTTSAAMVSGINVVCVGYSGTQMILKLNLGTAVASNATVSAATTKIAYLGSYSENLSAQFWGGVIREAAFSTTAASDSACTAYANTVKARLGITSW